VIGDSAMPRVFQSACEDEGCMPDDSALVCNAVTLVREPRTGAAEVGTLRRGDTVASRSVMHLRSPGVVVLRSDVPMADVVEPQEDSVDRSGALARGDTLFLLYYEGEGRWRSWHRTREMTVVEFWSGPPLQDTGRSVLSLSSISKWGMSCSGTR